ncbi:MAG: cytochrome c [Bacteriovoracaceae bacterium]|nr:cytochrome c [Bacteriovoracaceae bacterium]
MKLILIGGLLVPLLISCNQQHHDYTTRTVSPVPAPTTIEAREAEQSATPGGAKQAAVFVPEEAPASTPELVAQGKVIYQSNCISCHNKNPSENGSIGPAQAGTPWEVVKVKVVTGRYPEALPPGYTPARKTKAMRAFPKLEKDLPAIFAYLQSFK